MNGIMTFEPYSDLVGKQKEYPTKQDFINAVKIEFDDDINAEDVNTGLIRYFPNGTEDSEFNFGKGEGVYQFVDKKNKGVSEVWVAKLPTKCKFVEHWTGRCQNKAIINGYCEEHSNIKCVICGGQASHLCSVSSSMVCGEPLCNNTECIDRHLDKHFK